MANRTDYTPLPLDMKGCICHFVKWQIHPFLSKETYSRTLSGSRVNINIKYDYLTQKELVKLSKNIVKKKKIIIIRLNFHNMKQYP